MRILRVVLGEVSCLDRQKLLGSLCPSKSRTRLGAWNLLEDFWAQPLRPP